MNTTKFGFVFAILTAITSCGMSKTDYSGSWERQILDEELGVGGTEKFSLAPDSSFVLANNLGMTYNDSNFSYKTRFVTSVKGRWSIVDNKIIAKIDTSTYSFDTLPGETSLIPVKNNLTFNYGNTLSLMSDRIIDNLDDYYRTVFTEGSVLYINQPVVISDTVLIGECGGSQIIWNKSEIK